MNLRIISVANFLHQTENIWMNLFLSITVSEYWNISKAEKPSWSFVINKRDRQTPLSETLTALSGEYCYGIWDLLILSSLSCEGHVIVIFLSEHEVPLRWLCPKPRRNSDYENSGLEGGLKAHWTIWVRMVSEKIIRCKVSQAYRQHGPFMKIWVLQNPRSFLYFSFAVYFWVPLFIFGLFIF